MNGVVERWRKNNKNDVFIFVDTPEIADCDGKDTEHISDIVKSMRKIGFVHTFLIVINSEEPRFND